MEHKYITKDEFVARLNKSTKRFTKDNFVNYQKESINKLKDLIKNYKEKQNKENKKD